MEEDKGLREDLFYVSVDDPNQLRRNILETQKEMIVHLKKVEQLKRIRENKHNYMQEFSMVLKEINLLNSKLKKALPKTSIKQALVREKINRPSEKQDRLKNLERELDHVEGKIGELLP